MAENPRHARGYDATFEQFDTPLMEKVRRDAYGEDIGQHSWITANELREDIRSLNLTTKSYVLDFGCGPCGPATFIAKEVGCKILGIDVSPAALSTGRRRSEAMNVAHLVELQHSDGTLPPSHMDGFDAVVAFDVVLHLRNRLSALQQFSSVLHHGGKLLLTDAGVIGGPISNDEVRLRSINGFTQFVPMGYNEGALEACGFKVISVTDRTGSLIGNASGRLAARKVHSTELMAIEGADEFHAQQEYLQVVIELAERKALSRISYLAESGVEVR